MNSTLENESTDAQGRNVAGQVVEMWCLQELSSCFHSGPTLTGNTWLISVSHLRTYYKVFLQTQQNGRGTRPMKNEEQGARES